MKKISAAQKKPENDWYRIVNSKEEDDTTDIFIYSQISSFSWWGDEVTSSSFIEELNAVTTPKINLRINSPGGSVFEGIAIHNAVWQHDAHVAVYVESLAASIASVIALAGDELVMVSNSEFMIHEARGGVLGNSEEMREYADLLDKVSDNIASMYAEKAGGLASEWREKMRAETWYTAQETVDAKLADRVYTKADKKAKKTDDNSTENLLKAEWDLSIFNFQGREHAPAPSKLEMKKEDSEVANDEPTPDYAALIRDGLAKAENKQMEFDYEKFKNTLKGAVGAR